MVNSSSRVRGGRAEFRAAGVAQQGQEAAASRRAAGGTTRLFRRSPRRRRDPPCRWWVGRSHRFDHGEGRPSEIEESTTTCRRVGVRIVEHDLEADRFGEPLCASIFRPGRGTAARRPSPPFGPRRTVQPARQLRVDQAERVDRVIRSLSGRAADETRSGRGFVRDGGKRSGVHGRCRPCGFRRSRRAWAHAAPY